MTLTLPFVDQLPPIDVRWRLLSQWFTPPVLAQRFAKFALEGLRFPRVLEPAAGNGALVNAITTERPLCRVTAVEIDPRWANDLRQWCITHRLDVNVIEANYLATPLTEYDVVVMNPPYEDGLDAAFITRAMEQAPRVAVLTRVNALAGQQRHKDVWSRIGRDWQMTGLAYCARRPQFLAAGLRVGNAESDFCAVRLERGKRRRDTRVEWWT